MTKFRKNVIGAILCLVMLLVGVCAFTACGSKDLSVTFTVEGKTQTVDVVNGKVTMPADPEKEFYEFRGWYTTSTFDEGTEFTKDTEVKENLTVYAYFAPIHVGISVNGEAATDIKLEDLSSKTTEYTEDAASKNLTFDGWYIDANYSTKYVKQDTDNLYARYVATVTFDNGYETVYTTAVTPGTVCGKPSVDDIATYYMDKEDISYVDENGKEVDFSTKVDVNKKVTVLWKTPYLTYSLINGTSNYVLNGVLTEHVSEVSSYPVISVLSKNVTVSNDGTKGNVVAVDGYANNGSAQHLMNSITGARKVIINEGIQSIVKFYSAYNSLIESVELPKSLKILEESFNNMESLKTMSLPEGIDVIIDCFWAKKDMSNEQGYDFDVVIPSSVSTLSKVPYATKFADNSVFYKEDGRIYKNGESNSKILVCDYQSNVADSALRVPNGVTSIQVGVFSRMEFDYLYLPSSVTGAVYNSNYETYKDVYTGNKLTQLDYIDSPSTVYMIPDAYAICSLDDVKYVVFDSTTYPTGMSKFLFTQEGKAYDQSTKGQVVFVGEVTEGNISVNVTAINKMGDGTKIQKQFSVVSGTDLKKDYILEQISLTESDIGVAIMVLTFNNLDNEFVEGVKTRNQYINIEFEYSVLGFTYTENEDSTITVTGFDKNTAQLLENGTYLVHIPEYMNGKKVVRIADGAFKDIKEISKIYIPATVKEIGREAFMNTSNLEYISIKAGGLEVVGESAFENVGCIMDDGKYVKNPDITTIATLNGNKKVTAVYIEVPLSKITSIGANAFKSMAIAQFTAVEKTSLLNNKLEGIMSSGSFLQSHVKEGGYYFIGDNKIVKYLTSTTVKSVSHVNGNEIDKNKHKVQLIAIAAYGWLSEQSNVADTLSLGYSAGGLAKAYSSAVPAVASILERDIIDFEVMTGSVYFVKKVNFISVSKVHEKAFTDIDSASLTVYVYKIDQEKYIALEDVQAQKSDIFEEKWFCGVANDNNATMMGKAQESSEYMNIG